MKNGILKQLEFQFITERDQVIKALLRIGESFLDYVDSPVLQVTAFGAAYNPESELAGRANETYQVFGINK